MKHYLVIGGVAVAGVAVAGVFFLMGPKKALSPAEEQKGLVATTEQSGTPEESRADTSVISSIKEAMSLGKPMQCTYTLTEQGQTAQSSIIVDGQKYRATTNTGDMKSNVIFDGTTQYIWTDGAIQGIKISKTCLDELRASLPKNTVLPVGETTEEREKTLAAATKVICTRATEEDFLLPSGMTFADQCGMMKQSLDAMKDVKMPIPGTTTSSKSVPLPEGMKTPPVPTTFPQ